MFKKYIFHLCYDRLKSHNKREEKHTQLSKNKLKFIKSK